MVIIIKTTASTTMMTVAARRPVTAAMANALNHYYLISNDHRRHQTNNFSNRISNRTTLIALIATVLFINCITVDATANLPLSSTSSSLLSSTATSLSLSSIDSSSGTSAQFTTLNTSNNEQQHLLSSWIQFQTKSLNLRSDQYPHDANNNLFSQLNLFIQSRQRNASEISGNIFFKYFNTNGDLVYQSNLSNPHDFYAAQCNPNGRFAILMHGWHETCETTWMKQLIRKLGVNRGGCLICMDYGRYASESYVRLVRLFDPIVQILTLQLFLMDYMGFDMNNGYLFGFSYGGQLATESGRRLGYQRLKEIDTCDMAGPGFDHRSNQPNHRDAAQNVQCIHTSRDKGTRFYNCHQDWRLGNCGLTQIASNSPPFGSHGLCPYMYVNAFDHDFYAIEKPHDCVSKRMAKYWPELFKMGYMESRKWQVSGELFAQTSKSFPFNIITNGTENAISREVLYRDTSEETIQPSHNVLQRLREKILKYVFHDQRSIH